MSRVFTDGGLMTWEAYASGGRYGLPEDPKVIFQCLSDPGRRARYVVYADGDNAGAEAAVHEMPAGRLRELLAGSRELD